MYDFSFEMRKHLQDSHDENFSSSPKVLKAQTVKMQRN